MVSRIVGGWQVNNIVSFYSGTPFSVTASGTSLNAPENDQRADQVKSDVAILGGIGATSAYFDPLAFAPVTEARFGTAPFNVLRGPGVASWDLGIFRQFELPREMDLTDPHGGVQRHEPAAVRQSRRRMCPTCG